MASEGEDMKKKESDARFWNSSRSYKNGTFG